jgi:hypothetical protein
MTAALLSLNYHWFAPETALLYIPATYQVAISSLSLAS